MRQTNELSAMFAIAKKKYAADSTGNFITRPTIRGIVWEKTSGICWYCGRVMNPFFDYSIDHVLPIRAGGLDDYHNLVPACKRCNGSKGGKLLEEFRAIYEPGHLFYFERFR